MDEKYFLTIEEIGEAGKKTFLEAGGEDFTLIPCLNDHPAWVELVANWIQDFKRNGSIG